MVSQAYSGMPRYLMAFLHLRQPSSLLHLGKMENDVVVASSNLRLRGWNKLNDGNTVHMLRFRLVVRKGSSVIGVWWLPYPFLGLKRGAPKS